MANAAPSTQYQALFRACMKEAANQGRALMERLVLRGRDSLSKASFLAVDDMERRTLEESASRLARHEPSLVGAYPQELLSEFAHAIAGDNRMRSAVSFDALELMGEEQMQESLEQMRLEQAVAGHVEPQLIELNSLLCAVQGIKTMPADQSPLRAKVYVRSLRSVVMQSPVPAAVRTRWMRHLGDALGPELARAYDELAAMLRAQGVQPAGYQPGQSRDIAPAAAAASQPANGVAPATLLNLRELKRLLSGEMEGASAPAPAPDARGPDFSATMPAAFETLQEMKQVDRVMQRLKERQAGAGENAVSDPMHDHLRAQARGPAQSLALEVVDLMVEKIANDARLLAPVQLTVRELEPALLRLAMDDPRFFSDRKHPARRLLDEMTQRSLAWESIESPGFAAFIEPLQQAVEVLLSTRIEGAEPFDFALRTLEEAWGEAQKRDRHHREKAVRALLKAEQRNLLAERISKELRERPDVQAAPREVAAFIAGPWSQVLAQARLVDDSGSTDPGGHAGFIADLLWSVQPRSNAANTARLAKFSPILLEKVRHGLAMVDYPAPATKRFVEFLADAHQQAMRAGEEPARPRSLSTSLSREELEAMLGGDDDGEQAWLGATEARHSGFVDTNQSVTPKPLFQETHPGFSDTKPPEQTPASAIPDTDLRPGAWVDMLMDNGWGRYQVTWTSPHRTLFMFSGAGGRQHSMTRRLLGKMLQGGSLRLVSDRTVVDHALDEVADEALRNSLDLKL